MYELKIGTVSDSIALIGDTLAAPFRGGILSSSEPVASPSPAEGKTGDGAITEVYALALEGDPASLAAALSHLQALLNQAATYTRRGLGQPVYLFATPIQGEPQCTSLVLAGSLSPLSSRKNPAPGGSSLSLPDRPQGSLGIALTLERYDYWEGSAAFLPLSNRSATRVTTGISVTNHLDADPGHDNYVEIAGADIQGDLPAAVTIDYTNTAAPGTSLLDSLILHMNAHSHPADFAPVYEASGVSDAACSSGSKSIVSVTPTDGQVLIWTVPDSQAALAAGNDFMLLLRLAAPLPAADVIFHASLSLSAYQLLETPWTLAPAGQGLIELGVLTLPPALAGVEAGPATLTLRLYAHTTGGSRSVELDFLYLAAMDAYRHLYRVGRLLYNDECIVDDGFTGQCYLETNATALVAPNYNAFGAQAFLTPGLTHRIGFFQAGAHNAEIDRPGWVHVQYKPRRSIL